MSGPKYSRVGQVIVVLDDYLHSLVVVVRYDFEIQPGAHSKAPSAPESPRSASCERVLDARRPTQIYHSSQLDTRCCVRHTDKVSLCNPSCWPQAMIPYE